MRPSGHEISRETLQQGHRSADYTTRPYFAESAIPADLTKQVHSIVPRQFYVDTLSECCDCHRPFLFYAQEQRHWYETLQFHPDSECARCPECRKSLRDIRRCFARYSKRIVRTDLSDAEFVELLDDTIELWQEGLLRNEQTLRTLKNRAVQRMPSHHSTRAILSLLED